MSTAGNNLRITYVKLINHVVLGNKEFNIDNDIISILGKNGSGKSFLMDTLSPFSRSNRFISNYPIKMGETGFKQVNFESNGIIYETIHEYIPNKKSHSCKSYINKIDKGVKIELNPTGHNDKYEELVKQYLGFTNDCMTIGFLSSKVNGITSSKGVDRKKILESTIDNPILKKFKKNAKSLATEYTSVAKHCEKQKIQIANKYTEESLRESINSIEKDITQKREILRLTTKDYENYCRTLEDKNKLAKIDVGKISLAFKLARKMYSEQNLYYHYEKYQEALRGSQRLSEQFSKLNDNLQALERKLSLESEIEAYTNVLNEKSGELSNFSNKLYKYIQKSSKNNILTWLDNIIRLSKYFTDVFKSTSVIVANSENLDNIINDLVSKIKENDEFIIKYRVALSNIDGNKYEVNFQDNCNTCGLYSKFIKSDMFVTEHKTKWDKIINTEQPELHDKLNSLNTVKANIKTSLINHIENAGTYVVDLDKSGLSSLDTFLKECGNGTLHPKLTKFREWLSENISYVDNLQEKVDDINDKLSDLNRELVTRNAMLENSELEKDKIIYDINETKCQLKDYDEILSDPKYQDISKLNIRDEEMFRFMNMNNKDLESTYHEVTSLNIDIRQLTSLVDKTHDVITRLPNIIEKLLVDKTKLEGDLSNLRTLNKNLLDYTNKGKVLVRSRGLLEKDIPIALLRNNLKFIEDTTNNILASNEISMSVNIIASDADIIIEVTVRDKVIQDAVQLSAGETAIISLLLNSCILHILGYSIICLDEIDSNLDVIYRSKFNDIIYSIMSTLRISQVFCISHNIASNINYATKILLGDTDGLDLNAYDCTNLIKL